MAIDYSQSAFPKSRVKALDKADKVKAIEALDRAESNKAKKRAKGRCEVRETGAVSVNGNQLRCKRQDAHTHHLKGGIGVRNHGVSVMAEQKLRVCVQCHADIHAKVLKPTTAEHDAATVRYWRAR